MKFYMRDWDKSDPINDENLTKFAYAKIACINLAERTVVITWKGIGTYVKDRGFQRFFFIGRLIYPLG